MARSIVQLDLLSTETLLALQKDIEAKRGFVDDTTWGVMGETLFAIQDEIKLREK